MKTVFGELSLVMTRTTTPRSHHDKSQIRTNKEDCIDAKVWALHEWYDHDTRSRAPLDSTVNYPIIQSLTNIMRPVKYKPYHTFALRINPLELDDDDTIFISSRRTTFLDCALLGEALQIAPPYTNMGEALFGISSHGLECWSTRT